MRMNSFLAIVVVALLAGGCSDSGAASPVASPNATGAVASTSAGGPAGTARPPITLLGKPLAPCPAVASRALCGTLEVAENRAAPGGRQIGLRVVVLPATGTTVRPDPVFFLDGGPGGAATEDLLWVEEVYGALNDDRDFVLVDQRGTGGSNRLAAPEAPDVTGLTREAAIARLKEWAARVMAGLPGDPRFYTTSVAMDDIDQVRAALGADRINVIGASYGATAAQYYLRQHEDRVRSVVLDGGTLVDVPLLERIAPNSQRALDLVFARCAADAVCRAAVPDPAGDLRRALAVLERKPVTTDVADPWTGKPIVIDPLGFTGGIHAGLLVDERTAALPGLIHAAAAGDWRPVAEAIAASMGPASARTDQLVMSAVIRCSEAWAAFDPAETARLAHGSYLKAFEVNAATNQATACSIVPEGVVPSGDAQPARSNVPVLLVLGEADPQNPPANVADAPRDLPNSRTVVVPGEGHTVGHLGCMPDLIAKFVAAGSASGLDASCAATSVPLPPFVQP
ncbi:MAG TPA: alpha/beta fold hydrolase [Candidatus Limnocylindrales bacterium]|nr:alpha/beta fold hydrolase [Candidatus Limnocylindrales bacterium]